MSKKGKALIIVAAALFLALAGVAAYFLSYYRVARVPTASAKGAEGRSFKSLK